MCMGSEIHKCDPVETWSGYSNHRTWNTDRAFRSLYFDQNIFSKAFPLIIGGYTTIFNLSFSSRPVASPRVSWGWSWSWHASACVTLRGQEPWERVETILEGGIWICLVNVRPSGGCWGNRIHRWWWWWFPPKVQKLKRQEWGAPWRCVVDSGGVKSSCLKFSAWAGKMLPLMLVVRGLKYICLLHPLLIWSLRGGEQTEIDGEACFLCLVQAPSLPRRRSKVNGWPNKRHWELIKNSLLSGVPFAYVRWFLMTSSQQQHQLTLILLEII